jgi:hypothetical protein
MAPVKSRTGAQAAASPARAPGGSVRIRGVVMGVAPLLAAVRDAGGAAAHGNPERSAGRVANGGADEGHHASLECSGSVLAISPLFTAW